MSSEQKTEDSAILKILHVFLSRYPNMSCCDLLNLSQEFSIAKDIVKDLHDPKLKYPSTLIRYIHRNKNNVLEFFKTSKNDAYVVPLSKIKRMRSKNKTTLKDKVFNLLSGMYTNKSNLISVLKNKSLLKLLCTQLGCKLNRKSEKCLRLTCSRYVESKFSEVLSKDVTGTACNNEIAVESNHINNPVTDNVADVCSNNAPINNS